MRFRSIYIIGGGLFSLLLWLITDPDTGIVQNMKIGASTLMTITILLKSVLYVIMLHLSRKALFDYLDLSAIIDKAKQSSEGAGMVAIAIGLIMIAIALVIGAATSAV